MMKSGNFQEKPSTLLVQNEILAAAEEGKPALKWESNKRKSGALKKKENQKKKADKKKE